MSFQNAGEVGSAVRPADDGLPNCKMTIRVTTMPAGPRTRRITAAKRATTRMINDKMGQATQNEVRGESVEPVGGHDVERQDR